MASPIRSDPGLRGSMQWRLLEGRQDEPPVGQDPSRGHRLLKSAMG